jgi:hypothetical protein
METTVTLTLSLPTSVAQEVLSLIAARGHGSPSQLPETSFGVSNPEHSEESRPFLADMLQGNLEKVARFAVERNGRFYNDELAKELEIEDQFTSAFLGHLTRKLRKLGIQAEGHRKKNWYTTNRIAGRTLINLRPDVLEIFIRALK